MKCILNGVVGSKTSYAICTTNIILALQKLGVEVQVIPIGNAEWFQDQDIGPAIEKGRLFSTTRETSCIRLFHEFDIAPHYGKGLHVGFPIFEKTHFTEQEIHQLNSVDILFVCSEWAKRMIEDNGISTPVRIVHLGVDSSVFQPTPINPNTPFTFFFPGKYEVRKGFDKILDVFEKAFTVKDNFQLVFLPNNWFIGQAGNKEWTEYLMSSSLSSKFKFIPPLQTHHEVAQIYQNSDCVVSFSRAEGWNLPLLESLSCGRQVIATNYSAHTEFLTNENAILVDVDGLESALDGVFFTNPNNYWGRITPKVENELTEALKTAYKKGKVINQEGIKTAEKFTWEDSAKQIITHLEEFR